VAQACKTIDAQLVYFSSDLVFDGLSGPCRETDPARPINEYGRQKVLSEHYIALHLKRYLIVRTTGVYGWETQGKNFVQRLIHSLQAGNPVRVPNDQFGSPTYSSNLADAVIELATSRAEGVFHVVGPELVCRDEFAVAVARAFHLDAALIEPLASAELGRVAPRPLKVELNADKAEGLLETHLIDYDEGLRRMALEQPSFERTKR
jgi:dTDP-4-dehydrorhamnose reductase